MGVNRIEGAVWYNEIKKYNATVVGVGASGSFGAFLLARAGINKIRLVDSDIYELHNIGSQLVSFSDIGHSKVETSAMFLEEYTSARYINFYKRVIQDAKFLLQNSHSIILATLDSMEGRKFVFDSFRENTSGKNLFLDSRIGAEYYEVYCVPDTRSDYKERYRETLFSDSEGNVGACNYQQSSHCAAMAAAELVKLTTNYITNNIMDDDDIPFKITHDLRTNKYEVYY